MPDAVARVYWDACVFLSFIEANPDRAPIIRELLTAADEGRLEIVTSTISLVEVAFHPTEKGDHQLSADVEERIRKLWAPPSPVKLADVHVGIAEKARSLIRDALSRGLDGLKPLDAVHLATAGALGATAFQTYDDRIKKYAGLVPVKIEEPFVEQARLPL
jgi:predicted nucleic acid-binding protein